jgi:hypothetical protein
MAERRIAAMARIALVTIERADPCEVGHVTSQGRPGTAAPTSSRCASWSPPLVRTGIASRERDEAKYAARSRHKLKAVAELLLTDRLPMGGGVPEGAGELRDGGRKDGRVGQNLGLLRSGYESCECPRSRVAGGW